MAIMNSFEPQTPMKSAAELESVYDSIESEARREYQPPSFLPNISPRLAMILLAVAASVGALVGSADIKTDTVVTYSTELGVRSQPHWLVPKGAKLIKSEQGLGAIKGLGWILGGCGGAALWHLGGNDEKWQRFCGTLQTQWVKDYLRRHKVITEMESMALIQMAKQRLDTQVNIDLAEQTWQFHQAIGYDPLVAQSISNLEKQEPQNALPYGEPGTLDDINDPSDKVRSSTDKTPLNPMKKDKLALKMPPLTDYPVCLVFGAPGGGKSNFTEKVVKKKLSAGHRVVVLDPHYKLGSWDGCEVYGKAFDYEEIDAKLVEFCEEVKDRYRRLATEVNPVFEPFSIIAEEITMWGKRCKNAGAFVWQIVSDIRKVNCFATLVGHTNTLAGLGGKESAGSAKLILDAVLEVEIIAKQDPDSGRAVPAFQSFVKLPGMKRKDAFSVLIEPDTDTSESSEGDKSLSVLVADLPEDLSVDPWEDSNAKPKSEPPDTLPERGEGRVIVTPTTSSLVERSDMQRQEPLNLTQGGEFSLLDKKYTSLNLSKSEALALVRDTLKEKNKMETIESLWRCSRGGSANWREANRQYAELMSETV